MAIGESLLRLADQNRLARNAVATQIGNLLKAMAPLSSIGCRK